MTNNHPDLAAINLNHLVALDALLTARNVRLAAERCGVTQSAMSHTLARLREQFGDPLLVRQGNAMLATPRAEELTTRLRDALRALELVVRDREVFAPAQATGVVTIGASDVAAVTVLPRLIALLAKEAPGLDVAFVTNDRTRMEARLADGEVDLVLAPASPASTSLRTRPLYPTDFVVVVRKRHPALARLPRSRAARARPFNLDRYCALSHVQVTAQGAGPSLVDDALARLGRTRRIAVRVPWFLTAPLIIAQTDLVLTAPREAAAPLTRRYPLVLLPPPIALPSARVAMWWHERTHRDARSRWLRDAMLRAVSAP